MRPPERTRTLSSEVVDWDQNPMKPDVVYPLLQEVGALVQRHGTWYTGDGSLSRDTTSCSGGHHPLEQGTPCVHRQGIVSIEIPSLVKMKTLLILHFTMRCLIKYAISEPHKIGRGQCKMLAPLCG